MNRTVEGMEDTVVIVVPLTTVVALRGHNRVAAAGNQNGYDQQDDAENEASRVFHCSSLTGGGKPRTTIL